MTLSMMFNNNYSTIRRGFTLIELLLVIAIVSVISVAGVAAYRNFGKSVEMSSAMQVITADLRQMQSKAMAGEDGAKWGAHFVNNGADQYYQLFSTLTAYGGPSMVLQSTTTLSGGVVFSDPAPGFNKDVLFERITGMTTDATVSITSENITQSVTVKAIGSIY